MRVGVALVGLAADVWRTHDEGFGLATSALGFGALGGPLVGLLVVALVRSRWSRAGVALVMTGAPVALVAAAPDHLWALAPLAWSVQRRPTWRRRRSRTSRPRCPDERRAGVLGISDSAIVSAMMVGAFAAPVLAALIGDRWLMVLLGALCCAGVVWARGARPSTPVEVVDVREVVIDLRENPVGPAISADQPQPVVPQSNAPTRQRVASSQGLTAVGRT